jgi:hypothetical protein
MDLDPITEHYDLLCDPDHAFDVYVSRIAEWWHPDYTEGMASFSGVTIEPHVGGRVLEHSSNGESREWGTVMALVPGQHLAYTSNLGQRSGERSTISVDFTPGADGGTSVDFAHGGWNASNAEDRSNFDEWRKILDRFARMADADEIS